MPRIEPARKRVAAFVDGQSLFYAVKSAFGYTFPNYDVLALATEICRQQGDWALARTFFYTGIPDASDAPRLNAFWEKKLQVMNTRGVRTYSGGLRRRSRLIRCPHGEDFVFPYREEKGVDVRLALDAVRIARTGEADVLLILSQDQDLAEVAKEIRAISKEDDRWIKAACAYPVGPGTTNARGITGTDWIQIEGGTYDRCVDPLDYRRPLREQA